MATHSGILPGKFCGQRSLVGYSAWGRKESDTAERLTLPLLSLYLECSLRWAILVFLVIHQVQSASLMKVRGSTDMRRSVGLLLLSPGSQSTEGFVCALQASLGGMRIDFTHNWAPPTIAVKLLLCPWMWGMFFGGFQHFAVDRCSATSCKFSILTGKDKHMPFYSAILEWIKSLAVGKWTQFPTPVPSPGNLGVE